MPARAIELSRGSERSRASEGGSRTTVFSKVPTYRVDAGDIRSDPGTGNVKSIGSDPLNFTLSNAASRQTLDGIKHWNMEDGTELAAIGMVTGVVHTHAAWIRWHATPPSWRTVFRHGGHQIIVEIGSTKLGLFQGAFQPSGYNIALDGTWQHVVAVARTSATDFYINGSKVGVCNAVTSTFRVEKIGYGGQGPGRIAAADIFIGTALTDNEVRALYMLKKSYYRKGL